MKKAYLYTLLICIGGSTLLLSSCDKFLDIRPVGKVIPNSLSEYRSLLTKAYDQTTSDKAVCEMRTGNIIINNDEYDQASYIDIETWNDISPKATAYAFDWAHYYSAIYYTNAIISKKDEITGADTKEINQLVGEAYLLRAAVYFTLVNLYGQPYTQEGAPDSKAVPLRLGTDLEEVSSRNTVQEIYNAILNDIYSARNLLNQKEWEEKYLYRFNTLSADALESRVCLYIGNWKQAYDAAEKVLAVKATLEDYNDASGKVANQFQSKEVINAYEKIQSTQTVRASRATADFYHSFDATTDLRIAKYFGDADENGNYPIKKTDGTTAYRCSFRTGEMYLNAAEAAARLNQLSQARTRLLALLKRRYTPEEYERQVAQINQMQQADLLKKILSERSKELAFEGHAWFDLRRTDRPAINKTRNETQYTLQKDDPRYTLRIPKEAVEANPGLLN